MKLPNQTRGPVTLSKIDYVASMSEETVAFTATVEIDWVLPGRPDVRVSSSVRNDGRGGSHRYDNFAVEAALNIYAKTLPPLPGIDADYVALDMDGELLISLMVDAAIAAHEDAKAKKKGYTVAYEKGGYAYYGHGAPSDATSVRVL